VPRTTAPYLKAGQTIPDRHTRGRGTTELVFLIHTAVVDVVEVPLFGDMRIICSSLSIETINDDRTMKTKTYSNDFICDTLSFAFSLLEIGSTAIEFCRVQILVKLGLDTEKLFIGGELIPRTAVYSWAESILVTLIKRATRWGLGAWLPLLKLTFPCTAFLLTDIGVGSES
jgi:hypothetical protein